MDRILVGVDGSPAACAAVSLAAEIARGLQATLALAYAMPEVKRGAVPDRLAAEWATSVRDHGASVLAEAARRAEAPELRMEQQLLSGAAARALFGKAAADAADLIVVGRGDSDPLDRLLSGGTSDRLAENCARPVLVARGQVLPLRGRTIAVGIDGSPESQAAAEYATRLARATGAQLLLVHVRPPGEHSDATHVMHRHLERIASVLEPAAGGRVLHRIEQGKPALALSAVAADSQVALIALGHRGLGKVSRLLLGSVAAKLLEVSPRPVLIVR